MRRPPESKAARFFAGPSGKLLAVLFWLLVWQAAASLTAEPILLPSPIEVILRLFSLAGTGSFWKAVLLTGGRIVLGFLIAFMLGILLASLASLFAVARALITPPLAVIKSTPVASVILLLLIWFRPRALPLLVAALFVLPLVYASILEGIGSVAESLLEMAHSFQFGRVMTVRTIYLPALHPALLSSASTGTSVSFKAGVAAEIIAVPAATLGSLIYDAKIHLATADLFALTVAVVLSGALFEYGFRALLKVTLTCLERPGRPTTVRHKPEADMSVTLHDISFRYNQTAIFEKFSYTFQAGRHTVISGPSGAGKTTLIRLILGYLKPESGRIGGVPLRRSVVFQEDRLLVHLSAEENLHVVSSDREDNKKLLKAMGVDAAQPVTQLSGGEKRRVALARALVFDSSLLVLDEPYRSLDPELARQMEAVVQERTAGLTVIEISHRDDDDSQTGAKRVGRMVFCERRYRVGQS